MREDGEDTIRRGITDMHRKAISVMIGVIFIVSAGTSLRGAGTNEACSLLAQAHVSAVLGVSIGSGRETVPGASRSCTWSEPGATLLTGKRVRLEILGPLGSMTPVDRFEKNVKMPVDQIKRTPLSGVGDDAVYLGGGNIPVRLYVRKGSSVIHVVVTGFSSDDETKKLEKTLAQDALTKL